MDSNAMGSISGDEEFDALVDRFLAEASTDVLPPLQLQEVDPEPRTISNIHGREQQRERNPTSTTIINQASRPSTDERPKACNLHMSKITIGNWQRSSMREGDLVAKLYYKKKKLIWEILNGQLKSKMEIHWSDIIAIKAVMVENQPGILQIRVDNSPSFQEEKPPQPKKHTAWQPSHDFTGGQAKDCTHIAIFPSGVLDEPYKTLIKFDKRLSDLSQKPFTNEGNPHFDIGTSSNVPELSVNFNGPTHPWQDNTNGPMAEQYYPSQVISPMAHLSHINPNGPQINPTGPQIQEYLHPFPPRNAAVAGNQLINTPNSIGGAESSQLVRHTIRDALLPRANLSLYNPMLVPPRANPSLYNAERMRLPPRANPSLYNAERMRRANPSPQPAFNYHQVFPGHNYPSNNLVPPDNLYQSNNNINPYQTNHVMIPSNNINHYQTINDVNQVRMQQDNGPSVQPDTSVVRTEDDESFCSNNEDLQSIVEHVLKREGTQEAKDRKQKE